MVRSHLQTKTSVRILRVQYTAMGNDADRTMNRAMTIVNAASAVSVHIFVISRCP